MPPLRTNTNSLRYRVLINMHLPIADFSITTERDFNWAGQRARLLGTLAQLPANSRTEFGKAVVETARTLIAKPFRGNIQFAIGVTDDRQFVEATVIGPHSEKQLDKAAIQSRVDELLIDVTYAEFSAVKLRKYLSEKLPPLGTEDVTEWGTMLATRTTAGALVQVEHRLREVRSKPALLAQQAKDAQIHDLLALVVSTTDNSVIVMDAEGLVEWVNDSFTRMSGYELNEVQGQPFFELLCGLESDPTAKKEIVAAMQLGHGLSRDLLRYRKDNKTYWELLSLTPVFDDDGVASRWVAISTDISTRRAAEEALAQAKATAEAASNAKSDFLANMSHEIRTPMNAVIGMTDLALATKLTPEQHEYLSIVRESAQALMGLLNDVLDLSKIEAGKLDIEKVPFDIAKLIENTLKPFIRQAKQKSVEFRYNLLPSTPTQVCGDVTRVRQILVNLVSNAVKFTNSGSIAVNVEPQWESEDEVSLHFSVSDTGIGMSKETLQRIFEAFTQADSSITREYGGTGLGLTISARLAELLGGRIWVQSQDGKGSTFHVSLPFSKTDQLTETAPSQNTIDTTIQIEQPRCILQVLVADDNAANRILAQRVLEKRGHCVTLVDNGKEALEQYRQTAFHVAILDVQMPELDGYSVTAEIRREEARGKSPLPIIAMTAHAMPGDRQRCLSAGMDAYLPKPIEARELYLLVERLAADVQHPTDEDIASDELDGNPFAKALARLEGDEELLREQMQFFLDDSPTLMDQILAALDEERQEQVRLAAHRLKGLAATIEGGELNAIAGRVEQSSKSGSLDDVTAVIDDLAAALTRLIDQVSDYMSPQT